MPADATPRRWFQVRLVPEHGPDGAVESVLAVARDVTQLKEIEGELRARTLELGERVKELRCLYAISTMLARAGPDFDYQEIVNAMPAGWQFPELAQARLVLEGRVYATAGFRRTRWLQTAPVAVDGQAIGCLEICYGGAPPSGETEDVFLDEERMLLENLADQIASNVRRLDAETALVSSEARFRGLIEHSTDLLAIFAADGRTIYASPSYGSVLGYPPKEALAMDLFSLIHANEQEQVRQVFAELVRSPPGSMRRAEFRFRHKNGQWRHIVSTGTNLLDDADIGGVVVNSHDVTDRVKLEAEFRQAQKMEAVGRLAGGVAHDFNNILTVMDANAAFLLEELAPSDPRHEEVREIKKAAERAATLTRQLLAFSRRQVLQPRVLDVNTVVSDMHKMLRRLIGEDVELVTLVTPGISPVFADPGQVEQILLNLTVNARDAMPAGGKLTIEARNVELDATYTSAYEDVEPGVYVMIAVSDTGAGMDKETQAQIFEPFFTTKSHGTGLGLATVYGIVKQSGGHIAVYSEAGLGTTFKVYLPACEETAGRHPTGEMAILPVSATETILLVEDEPAVRAVAKRVLGEHGYTVLEACNGVEALQVAAAHPARLDMLVTDVVMPQMNGHDLAKELTAERSDLRVLYVSGYTDDAIAHAGILEPGTFLLEKPFTPDALLRKVRLVLSEPLQALERDDDG